MCSASAHTDTRPLRGVQSLGQGGSSASATIALEAEIARLSPRLRKKTQRVASQATAKTAALYSFRGFSERGGDNTPFLFAQTSDSKKLENIRENASLRGLESIESSVDSESKTHTESGTDLKAITESKEILKNEKIQNLGDAEPRAFTESSPRDSKTRTESKEILNNAQRQNLSPKKFIESDADLESKKDSESSSIDSIIYGTRFCHCLRI